MSLLGPLVCTIAPKVPFL